MFNPQAKLQVINFDDQHKCLVVDDALMEPELWVKQAILYQDKFVSLPGNAYPGIELRMADDVSKAIMDFIRIPAKQYLNVRRFIEGYSRFAMVTKTPEQLRPCHWICHRDKLKTLPGQSAIASIIYLFKEPALGGTLFFKPKKTKFETDLFLHSTNMMPAEDFEQKFAIKPAFMTESNEFFELIGTVPAKWNRLIFYDGMQFHSGNIQHPEKMTNNPELGRLTLNGFFTGRAGLA